MVHLDLPYGKLGGITEKEPLNYCILHLPDAGGGGGSSEPTTSFDEARRGKWGALSINGPLTQRVNPQRPPMKDASFARWEVTALPHKCTLAEALNRIAYNNSAQERVLKYKIRFRDASELTFSRSEPDQSSSLAFSNYYSPADSKKRVAPSTAPFAATRKHNFLVDSKGHTVFGKRSGGGNSSAKFSGRLPSLGNGSMTSGMSLRSGSLKFPNVEERKKLFDTLDPNANGKLSLAELDRGVIMLWPQFNHKPAIMRAYKAADANGTGLLGRHEFKAFLKFLHFYNELWTRFSKVDISGDRRVTLDELNAAAPALQLSPVEVGALFQRMDSNQGGYVLFDEFAITLAQQRMEKGGSAAEQSMLQRAAGNHTSYEARTSAKLSSAASSRSSQGAHARPMPPLVFPPMESVDKIFNDIDPNGNGILSLAELDKACVQIWPQFNHKPAIMRAYKAADKSGNGFIGRKEFSYFLKYIVHYNELWRTFQQIDRSNDRRISMQELVCGWHFGDNWLSRTSC